MEIDEITKKLRDGLKATPERINTALEIAGKNIAEHARTHHKFKSRSEKLENNIKWEVNNLQVTVGLSDVVPYGKYVHGGTKPHVIEPKDKKILRFPVGGKFVFAKRVLHPGTEKDEFIYEAFDVQMPKIKALFDMIGADFAGGRGE